MNMARAIFALWRKALSHNPVGTWALAVAFFACVAAEVAWAIRAL